MELVDETEHRIRRNEAYLFVGRRIRSVFQKRGLNVEGEGFRVCVGEK